MSDREIICAWMGWTNRDLRDLGLDALHVVEAQLTDDQWRDYHFELCVKHQDDPIEFGNFRGYLHASAEVKIKALAAVLRPAVEKAA